MDAVVAVLAVGAVRATSMASVLGSAAASIGITRGQPLSMRTARERSNTFCA
jgi:hypothetical protein